MGPDLSRGKVPHFTMRPHPIIMGLLILVPVSGLLLAMSFFSYEEGTGRYYHRGILTLIITGIMWIFLLILATSKLWFPHLWKKNSTHARHKQHTRFHPSIRDREYRHKN
jgi:hypothetical protein